MNLVFLTLCDGQCQRWKSCVSYRTGTSQESNAYMGTKPFKGKRSSSERGNPVEFNVAGYKKCIISRFHIKTNLQETTSSCI